MSGMALTAHPLGENVLLRPLERADPWTVLMSHAPPTPVPSQPLPLPPNLKPYKWRAEAGRQVISMTGVHPHFCVIDEAAMLNFDAELAEAAAIHASLLREQEVLAAFKASWTMDVCHRLRTRWQGAYPDQDDDTTITTEGVDSDQPQAQV